MELKKSEAIKQLFKNGEIAVVPKEVGSAMGVCQVEVCLLRGIQKGFPEDETG